MSLKGLGGPKGVQILVSIKVIGDLKGGYSWMFLLSLMVIGDANGVQFEAFGELDISRILKIKSWQIYYGILLGTQTRCFLLPSDIPSSNRI